nr:hypothetical protein [Tanacetum cinerariifolium]
MTLNTFDSTKERPFYYVRFAKLINDMRNIKMTMSRMQLNSKFVNNMLPEWGRFMTAHYSQSSLTPPFTYVSPHFADNAYLDSGLSPTDNLIENLTNTLALLTQSYKTFLPQTNNQLRTSSNTRNQATVQDGRVVVQNVQGRQNRGQGTNPQGGGAVGYGGVQNRVGNANSCQAKQVKSYNYNGIWHIAKNCTQPKRPQNFDYYEDKMLLMQAQENGVALDEEQLLFLAGGQDNTIDEDAPTARTIFMANLSSVDPVYDEAGLSYDSDILSEVYGHDHYQDAVRKHHKEHAMHDNVQLNHVVNSHADYTSDRNMISYDQYVKENAIREIAEITKRKMYDKMKDPECVNHKVKIAPHDYSKENFLATFTPQKQLTPEQIFWSQDLIKMKTAALKEHTTTSRPIKALTVYPPNTHATLVPMVLPTKSQVKIYIFTLIQLFSDFDKTCKKRITLTGLTEGERGFEQTKECYLTELKYQNLKDSFGNNPPTPAKDTPDFDSVFVIEKMQASLQGKDNVIKQLKKQISHLQQTRSEADRTLNFRALDSQITQLTEKVTVLQAQNDLFRAENEKIKQHYKELYDSIKITRAKHIEQVTALTAENVNLKAQILNTVNSVCKDHVKPTVLAPKKYVIDVEPIPSLLRNNRDTHLDYLMHLKESVETIRDIVEEAKFIRPLDSSISLLAVTLSTLRNS